MFPERIKKLKAYKTETTPARIKLSSNEFPYDLPEGLKRKISEEIRKASFNRYPDPESKELKEVISDFFGVKEDNIVLGNGSDELIYYLSVAVGDFKDPVLLFSPSFPMYEIACDVFGRKKVISFLDDEFDIDTEDAEKKVKGEKIKLVFYSYPNNPTGNLFSREKIEKIRKSGVFTVLDEAYYNYSKETFLKDALEREDTVVLRTLSKIGLAGLRIGILIGKEEIVREINKVRLPFNITLPSQIIAKVILTEGREFIEKGVSKVIEERERVFKELKNMDGITPFPSRANFILFRTEFPAEEVHRRLIEKGVLIRNMSYLPKLENCLRVSIGRPEENDAFLEALNEVIRSF